MKTLLTVMVVMAVGGALILAMHAVEIARMEGASGSPADSADYVTMMEWAIRHQHKQIEQLRNENAVLAAELAQVSSAGAEPVASHP